MLSVAWHSTEPTQSVGFAKVPKPLYPRFTHHSGKPNVSDSHVDIIWKHSHEQ
jgi:hypothetical protein